MACLMLVYDDEDFALRQPAQGGVRRSNPASAAARVLRDGGREVESEP